MSHMLELMYQYDILHRIHLGRRNLVVCYDHSECEQPYMTCYAEYDRFTGKFYSQAVKSDSYLEVMKVFLDRLPKHLKDAETFRAGRPCPLQMLDYRHCRPRGEEESLKGQLVILDARKLEPEYRTADCQLCIALEGNGCSPNSRFGEVFVRELYSDIPYFRCADDILGLADVTKLPDWARDKIREQEQHQPRKELEDK